MTATAAGTRQCMADFNTEMENLQYMQMQVPAAGMAAPMGQGQGPTVVMQVPEGVQVHMLQQGGLQRIPSIQRQASAGRRLTLTPRDNGPDENPAVLMRSQSHVVVNIQDDTGQTPLLARRAQLGKGYGATDDGGDQPTSKDDGNGEDEVDLSSVQPSGSMSCCCCSSWLRVFQVFLGVITSVPMFFMYATYQKEYTLTGKYSSCNYATEIPRCIQLWGCLSVAYLVGIPLLKIFTSITHTCMLETVIVHIPHIRSFLAAVMLMWTHWLAYHQQDCGELGRFLNTGIMCFYLCSFYPLVIFLQYKKIVATENPDYGWLASGGAIPLGTSIFFFYIHHVHKGEYQEQMSAGCEMASQFTWCFLGLGTVMIPFIYLIPHLAFWPGDLREGVMQKACILCSAALLVMFSWAVVLAFGHTTGSGGQQNVSHTGVWGEKEVCGPLGDWIMRFVIYILTLVIFGVAFVLIFPKSLPKPLACLEWEPHPELAIVFLALWTIFILRNQYPMVFHFTLGQCMSWLTGVQNPS